MKMLAGKTMYQTEATQQLGTSVRQVNRIFRDYRVISGLKCPLNGGLRSPLFIGENVRCTGSETSLETGKNLDRGCVAGIRDRFFGCRLPFRPFGVRMHFAKHTEYKGLSQK